MQNKQHAPSRMKNQIRTSRSRKRKGEGEQSRHEILAGAKRLFVEEGYEATTIRRIAARVGISSTTLYVYFRDKDAILTEICNETFAALIQRLDAVRRERSDPLKALEEVLEGYIRFGLDHPNEYELTFIAKPRRNFKGADSGAEELGMQAFQGFYECVNAVVRSGLTYESDAERLAKQLWAGAHGLVALLLSPCGIEPADLDSLLCGHVAMLIRGVAKGRAY
jgi:AcrR family transcriptional regulator